MDPGSAAANPAAWACTSAFARPAGTAGRRGEVDAPDLPALGVVEHAAPAHDESDRATEQTEYRAGGATLRAVYCDPGTMPRRRRGP